jgi:hypothetical protein
MLADKPDMPQIPRLAHRLTARGSLAILVA